MNTTSKPTNVTRRRAAFSLIEMLTSVAIIGVISFLAIPNLIRMRGDSERNLAIARAEAINMSIATLIQVRGRTQANLDWSANATAQLKYANCLSPYLAFAEVQLTDFIPTGYSITFNSIDPLRKVTLMQGTTVVNY